MRVCHASHMAVSDATGPSVLAICICSCGLFTDVVDVMSSNRRPPKPMLPHPIPPSYSFES